MIFTRSKQACRCFVKTLSAVAEDKMLKKLVAPAADRNKEPILEVLKTVIHVPSEEDTGQVTAVKILEVSSGTGQHIAHFAKHLSKQIFWQPSEYDTRDFGSISAYIQEESLRNVAPPILIDIRIPCEEWNPVCMPEMQSVTALKPLSSFPPASLNYIYNSNLMHISSFDCTEGLFRNSGILLKSGGCLITYGPYSQNGVISPESNIRFNAGLKQSDASWGIRDIQQQLIPLAGKNGLKLTKIIDMPANNKILLWMKQ